MLLRGFLDLGAWSLISVNATVQTGVPVYQSVPQLPQGLDGNLQTQTS